MVGFPPFMLNVLELVNSPAEPSKCVVTRIKQEPEAPAQNRKNQTVRFGKPDGLVLSIPMAGRGATDTRRGSFSSDQATYGRKIGKNHGNPRG
jgi:hypothetical protein